MIASRSPSNSARLRSCPRKSQSRKRVQRLDITMVRIRDGYWKNFMICVIEGRAQQSFIAASTMAKSLCGVCFRYSTWVSSKPALPTNARPGSMRMRCLRRPTQSRNAATYSRARGGVSRNRKSPGPPRDPDGQSAIHGLQGGQYSKHFATGRNERIEFSQLRPYMAIQASDVDVGKALRRDINGFGFLDGIPTCSPSARSRYRGEFLHRRRG